MRSLLLVLVTALFATAIAACGGSGDDATVATSTLAEAEQAATGREPAPAIAGTSLDGDAISLAGFAGRPVLINVWSSW